MLYIIGLGLADEKDISVKGLEIVRKADRVYLEAYTAVLLVDQGRLVSVSSSLSRSTPGFIKLTEYRTVGSILWTINRTRRPRDGRITKRRNLKRRRYQGCSLPGCR